MTASGESFLIVRLSALGDVVDALPSLDALRRRFPDARIGWVVERESAGLLQGHPQLNDLFVLPRKQVQKTARGLPAAAPFGETFRVIKAMRATRYGTAIDFQGNLRSGIVCRLSGAARRIGYAKGQGKELNHLFLTEQVDTGAGPLHRAEKQLRLVQALGADTVSARAVIPLSRDGAGIAAAWEKADARKGPRVIIHPGTSAFGAFKQWPPERFGQVAAALAAEVDARVLVTWGPGEEARALAVVESSRGGAVAAPATPSVADLAALMSQADGFIGSDSGPAHIADALGLATIVLFGPKDPRVYGPRSPRSRAVRASVPCSPCTRRSCPRPVCMTGITPDQVITEAKAALAGRCVP